MILSVVLEGRYIDYQGIILIFSVLAEKETCNLLQKGVAAIFGPQTLASSEHIRSITDVAEG